MWTSACGTSLATSCDWKCGDVDASRAAGRSRRGLQKAVIGGSSMCAGAVPRAVGPARSLLHDVLDARFSSGRRRVAVTPADAYLASLGAARCVKDVLRAGVAASRADPAKRAVANRAVQREPAE